MNKKQGRIYVFICIINILIWLLIYVVLTKTDFILWKYSIHLLVLLALWTFAVACCPVYLSGKPKDKKPKDEQTNK